MVNYNPFTFQSDYSLPSLKGEKELFLTFQSTMFSKNNKVTCRHETCFLL